MFRSRLFLRMFILATPVLAVFSIGIYYFSVPMIRSTVYEIEQNAGRTILNNVFDLALRIQLDLERHRAVAMDARRHELRTVVDLAAAYGRQIIRNHESGDRSMEDARHEFFDKIRDIQYGQNGYIWIADYNGVLVSHPDPEFHGTDLSRLPDSVEKAVVTKMVATARQSGDGYEIYNWRRLGAAEESQKLSYFRDFPEWSVIIGTGVYVDDVAQEVESRKRSSVNELREVVRSIQIANTGYLYIFDANLDMIIHPNPNIERTNFSDLVDPLSGRLIGQKLMAAAGDPDGLIYKWDKPSDPGNYVYDKVAWVRHFEAFDWYIASSVYVEELQRSAEILRKRVFVISIIGFFVAAVLMSLFIRQITRPIVKLSKTAERVQRGDLAAQSNLQRNDEFGLLSQAFDSMIREVRGNIDTLDNKVRERTSALEAANTQLTEAIDSKEAARLQLSQAEIRQRLILNAIPSYIGYFDKNENLLFANKIYAEQIMKIGKDLSGVKFRETLPKEIAAIAGEHLDRAYAGETVTFDSENATPLNDIELRRNILIPEVSNTGTTEGVFFISRNITEEKRAEQRLMEAQRMSATGQLAGGLAHDFNNLLSVIIGNLAGARDKYDDVPELDGYLEPAYRASKRGADITARLLAFSRKQPLKPNAVNLGHLATETIALLRSSIPGNIEIRLSVSDDACDVFADPSQMENALVNLALNARDAMPDGGALTIEAAPWTGQPSQGFDEPVRPGEYGALRIADTGEGFSDLAREHAFEPFFSTKTDRGGTGLGLSMVYGFVKQSEGYLRIANRLGGGAEVTILLPLALPEAAGEEDAAEKQAGGSVGWRDRLALLVEDDPDVRQVVRRYLVELGFCVIEADNGDEALSLLEDIDDIFVLVSDVVLPSGMSGLDIAKTCRSIRPDVHVLLMTGFAPTSGASEFPFVTLRKPFDMDDLAANLRKVIGRSADKA